MPDHQKVAAYSVEIEIGVLGSILADGTHNREEAAKQARLLLTVEDFYADAHRDVFAAMMSLHELDGLVDGQRLVQMLVDLHLWNDGIEELVDKLLSFPSPARVMTYIGELKRLSRRRGLADALRVAVDHLDNAPLTKTEDVLAGLDAALATARQGYSVEREGAIGPHVDAARLALKERGESGATWTTGIPPLDGWIGGFSRGQHWVVAGRSQHGKTALALNMALATIQAGWRVLICRFEENAHAMIVRLAALLSGIPYSDITAHKASEADEHHFDQAFIRLRDEYGAGLRVLVGCDLGKAEAVISEFRPSLVVWDTIQAMGLQLGGPHKRHDLNVGDICGSISRMALAYDHAAVAISQLRKSTTGIPTMVDLRESGAIEEAADVVAFCWWPCVERGDDVDSQFYLLKVAKNRVNGQRGRAVCHIHPPTQKFGERLDAEDERTTLAQWGV